MTEQEALAQNRRIWDAAVVPHAASAFYDVEGFLAGRGTLAADLLEELGPVAGLLLPRFKEYPWCSYRSHAFLVEREGRWIHPDHAGGLPLMFSLVAVKP